jgi:hypothetical protein
MVMYKIKINGRERNLIVAKNKRPKMGIDKTKNKGSS